MKNKNTKAVIVQPGEILTAGMLMALHNPPPELPPVAVNEKAIKDALDILRPKPAEREQCREDIKAAFAFVEHNDLVPRSKQVNEALAQLLAALKRAQAAKTKLPWAKAHHFETTCDLEAGIAFCGREEVERKQTASRKPRPPSHRQRQAVSTAYGLVCTWLVGRGTRARSLSKQSAWYKLSAILFGKKVNLLAHMSHYQKGLTRFNATVADISKCRKPGSK